MHEDCFFSDFDGDALSNISISPADVKEILEQLKVDKSCGPDMISPRLLKLYFFSVLYLVYQTTWRWLLPKTVEGGKSGFSFQV